MSHLTDVGPIRMVVATLSQIAAAAVPVLTDVEVKFCSVLDGCHDDALGACGSAHSEDLSDTERERELESRESVMSCEYRDCSECNDQLACSMCTHGSVDCSE